MASGRLDKTTRRLAGRRITPFLAVAFAAAIPVAGCLPGASSRQRPAPAVMESTDTARAHWRNMYEQNRPEPPRTFSVFPKPPRNNSFAEFSDDLHAGLDTQPELPPLPSDSFVPPPGGGAADFMPPPAILRSAPARDAAGSAGAADYAAFPPTRLTADAGITAGTHYYPVEQLVYGGDHPDLNTPESYRLMPKDVITVTVKDHPEFSGRMEIQPDGTVRIPNAPDIVMIRGMTADQAADELSKILTVYVLGECRVRVQANRARGGYYFVFGDVQQPGRFPMGLEPIRLSEAVLAANWEVNTARRGMDGDELGPSFPAASPRGRYTSPGTADLARVILITPHRSQPVRTLHDVRAAMLGVTANDPVIRPGQIVMVPSLLAERNGDSGLFNPPEGMMPENGFAGAQTPARFPEITPPARPPAEAERVPPVSAVETNMTDAFDVNLNTAATDFQHGVTVREGSIPEAAASLYRGEEAARPRSRWVKRRRSPNPAEKRAAARRPEAKADAPAGAPGGWKKGL